MIMVSYYPDRWHSSGESSAVHLQRLYSTPRAWYRRSVMAPSITNSESPYYSGERYITAAAIVDRTGPAAQTLVDLCPWATVIYCPGRDYAIVIVSAEDRLAWVNRARLAGARAWYVVDSSQGELYQYIPPDPTEDPYCPPRRGEKRGKKNIDHAAVREDLERGYYNDSELAEKYSVTRQTISNIRKKFGLRLPVRVKSA